MKAVLQERESVWDELVDRCKGKVVGKCKSCAKSQVKKIWSDTLLRQS